MLHGKLASETGQLYTPTHSSKGGRRYFYYTLLGERDSRAARSVRRLPASEIEARVITSLSSFLADGVRVTDYYPGLPLPEMRMLTSAASHRTTLLSDGSEQERAGLISRIVSSVVVQSDALRIQISKGGLKAELLGGVSDGCEGSIHLREACQFAKRGNEVRLILASNGHDQCKPVPTLVRTVAQAKTWYEWIVQGEVRTMRELAKRTGFNENYVSRILDLAVLSPDITEAIFRGDHDSSLTVAQLTANIALDWMLQRLPQIGSGQEKAA
jgi:hypothetical protein